MGHYEDLYWEIDKEIKDLGLRKQFDKQLEKMHHQDKHQFKEARQKWEYARDKVIAEFEERKYVKTKKSIKKN